MARTPRGAFTLAEDERRPRARWIGRLLLLTLVAVVGIGGWWGVRQALDSFAPRECRVTAAGQTFDWAPDQASNTAVITAIALRRGMVPRAATIAIATAIQESKVRNITYGDRDSVGLFQQRPSQGWGTVEQIMNPEYSSNAFYDALEKVSGWQTMDIATAAQEVQRSADGRAYAAHESKARITASVLSGNSPEGFVCRLDAPTTPADGASVAALVKADHALDARVDGDVVVVPTTSAQQAAAVGAWAVARSSDTGVVEVTVAAKQWTRGTSSSALAWHSARTPAAGHEVVLRLR